MPLYRLRNEHLVPVAEEPFALERDIQNLVEQNIGPLLDLQYVKREHVIGSFRIDTLAFDPQAKAFVIVEYKKDKNFSVIDQGYTYLSLLLNNKADFVLEYNENKNAGMRKADVDWTQSRVIFVSPSYTPYQRESINFRDLPIELWEIKRFVDGLISFNRIQNTKSTESIKTLSATTPAIETVTKEIKVYDEEEHLAAKPEAIIELYNQLRNRIVELGDVQVRPTKLYIGFVGNGNFCDAHIQKGSIKLWINIPPDRLHDPLNMARDVSQVGHWGNGNFEIMLMSEDGLEYALSLIKQAYNYDRGVLGS